MLIRELHSGNRVHQKLRRCELQSSIDYDELGFDLVRRFKRGTFGSAPGFQLMIQSQKSPEAEPCPPRP